MAYVQRRDRPRNQHICSICLQLCSYSSTFCNECEHWVHNDCDNIAKEKREQFEKLPIDHQYICRKCRCDKNGNLDFVKSMLRLNKDIFPSMKKVYDSEIKEPKDQDCNIYESISGFKLDNTYGVEPPPISLQSQNLYEAYVHLGKYGAGPPTEHDRQTYIKYMQMRYM